MDADWTEDLERWLEPFLNGLGHKARRRMCPAYVAGLIGPGDRKSIQPMAARADEISYDRLHHFIGAGLWDSKPLEVALWQHADGLVGGQDAWLIIDDTALPKKGRVRLASLPNMRQHWVPRAAASADLPNLRFLIWQPQRLDSPAELLGIQFVIECFFIAVMLDKAWQFRKKPE
jgi:hypothetical protein